MEVGYLLDTYIYKEHLALLANGLTDRALSLLHELPNLGKQLGPSMLQWDRTERLAHVRYSQTVHGLGPNTALRPLPGVLPQMQKLKMQKMQKKDANDAKKKEKCKR